MPRSIYKMLCDNKKLPEWKQILCDRNNSYQERLKAKERILDYTVSITFYQKLPYENHTDEVLFKECGVSLLDCPYDFTEEQCCGLGLIRKKAESKEVDLIW